MTWRNSRIRLALFGVTGAVLVAMLLSACEREEYDPQATAEAPGGEEPGQASVGSDKYAMRVNDADLTVDAESTVKLEILPGSELEINLDYPWAFEFDDVEGVELVGAEFGVADLDLNKERAIIALGLTARKPGRHKLTGTGDFSVCNDDICEILRGEPVEFVVEAE